MGLDLGLWVFMGLDLGFFMGICGDDVGGWRWCVTISSGFGGGSCFIFCGRW